MPFTFSHPAIILPFKYLPNRWISMTGLIIGSLTPDFEYFIRMKIESYYSHTFVGLFLFDLPIGLLFAFIFHNLIRDSLILNLPEFLKSRFKSIVVFNWNEYFKKNWLIVSISILIGASSHIFWDGFTHKDGYFTILIPSLNHSINLIVYDFLIFKVLQHTSSLIGAIVIIITIFKLPIKIETKESINWNYWILVSLITFFIIFVRYLFGLEIKQYGTIIVSTISATLISLSITPLILKLLNKK